MSIYRIIVFFLLLLTKTIQIKIAGLKMLEMANGELIIEVKWQCL